MAASRGEVQRPRTSTREPEAIRAALEQWLAQALGLRSQPVVALRGRPGQTGMSSDTILFDLDWWEGGVARAGEFVLRLPPPPDAYPIFPKYDLSRQVGAMRLVAERSAVPVPRIAWYEPDPRALGAPFLVMERIDGVVPPDVMPYVYDSWLSNASAEDQAKVERGVVEILCGIHSVLAEPHETAFLELDLPGDTALRRHFAEQKAFFAWMRAGRRFPVIEKLFAWLEDRWPRHAGDAVVCWGDARIGNVLFRACEPVAVLDWESAAMAPRETDLGWLIFFHRYFQDYAEQSNCRGMPDFLRPDAVAARYAEFTGHAPRDLDWYLAYAALRQALVSIRTSGRAVQFGERPEPSEPDDLIQQRVMLERVLDGTQRWT